MISGSALIRSWVRALCASSKFDIGGKCLELDYFIYTKKAPVVQPCRSLDLNPISFPFAEDTVLVCMICMWCQAMGQPWAGEILGQPKRLQEALSLASCHFLWMLANACIKSGEEM